MKLCALALLASATVFATDDSVAPTPSPPPAGRLTGTFDGIEFEYSPGQEELVRLLALRFAGHNLAAASALAAKKSAPAPVIPLSPADLRANRATYLAGITAQLGLQKPTALQEECYDAFLDNYEESMLRYADYRQISDSLQIVKRVRVWVGDELKRRLGDGEKIPGFSYDPVTKKIRVSYGAKLITQDDRSAKLAEKREKMQLAYKLNIETKEGVTSYHGKVEPKTDEPKPAPASAPTTDAAEGPSEWFPVLITPEQIGLPAAELAPKLWNGSGARSLTTWLEQFAEMGRMFRETDPVIACMVLHETTEVGIVEHYFQGPDRRWFCDGVANYVPWRVVRELHGETVAATVYDLPGQLASYAPMREQADLRKWPATENQSEEEGHTELDVARYAFATNAIFLMNAHAGENILPRLFNEIGKTKPDKVSIKTVEKAWKKLTGKTLDSILAEAVHPRPTALK